jgi:HD superfamily phosphohydrolase
MMYLRFEGSLNQLRANEYPTIPGALTDIRLESDDVLLFKSTAQELAAILGDREKKERWEFLVTMAGLLHDIGHGPLSHTLEDLKVLKKSNFGGYGDPIFSKFFSRNSEKLHTDDVEIDHEDIGLIYIEKIFKHVQQEAGSLDCWAQDNNMHVIAALFHKKFREFYLEKHSSSCDKNLIQIFAPIISGFCDVDRLDYLARDSYNSGTGFSFEMDRMVDSIIPVLYLPTSKSQEKKSAFIINDRSVHMIDHFLFSLYQFYVQILFHPRQVQAYDQLKIICQNIDHDKLNFEWHSTASDVSFLQTLNKEVNKKAGKRLNMIDNLLHRKYSGDVLQAIGSNIVEESSVKWHSIKKDSGRKVLKDGIPVFLNFRSTSGKQNCCSWNRASLVATKLNDTAYDQIVWWQSQEFDNDIKYLTDKKLGNTTKLPEESNG